MSSQFKPGAYLYDARGQAYRFDSEDEIADRKIDRCDAPGISAGQETAPADWQAKAEAARALVEGRHAVGSCYHVYFAYGVVFSTDFMANIYCLHRHLGVCEPRCFIDYSAGWHYV